MARAELPAILARRWTEIQVRFWSRVDRTETCWVWIGGRQKRADGSLWYGVFCIGHGKSYLAHHVAWIAENGAVPDGLVLRHSCDNPACVRSAHIEPGTQAQNLEDMRVRGRAFTEFGRSGVEHPAAKMNPGRVREIRALREQGLSVAKIGAVVGLHGSTVHDIVTGKTWRHVS